MRFNSIGVKVKNFATKETFDIVDHGSNGGFIYKPNLFFVIEAQDQFVPGNYSLEFTFDYELRKDLAGFYLSTYKNEKGETRSTFNHVFIVYNISFLQCLTESIRL